MAYYDNLIAKWPSLTSTTTADKLAEINALTVAGPRKPVPIAEVMDYLRTNNLWLPIKQSAAKLAAGDTTASLGAAAAVDLNDDMRMQNINFDLQIVQEMLADLVAHNLLSQAHSDALNAMGNSTVPWWQANGYKRQISKGDVVVAGLDSATGYSAVISTPASNQFNVTVSVAVTGPKTTETVPTFAATLDADYAAYFAANCVDNMITRDTSLASFGG